MTVRDLIAHRLPTLSPSEKRIARVVTERYPVSALGQIEDLARQAQVSAPTVTRFARRLGFDRYADFQRAIRAEVQDSEVSPLALLAKFQAAARPGADRDAALVADIAASVQAMLAAPVQAALDRAADLLADTRAPVHLLGGRFTSVAAQYLAFQLSSLRGQVQALLPPPSGMLEDRIADFGRRDLLVVFDVRRYAPDIAGLSTAARKQGARIVLFTDPELSPVCDLADVTLPVPVATTTPMDTLAPLIATADALLARLVERLDAVAATRMRHLERLRQAAAAPR